jgi:anaerobic C4-dicarboxylate transporter
VLGIIAVITALAAMQSAGGLDYLVAVAEKVMCRHASYITFVAPVVTYILVLASGTAHVIYALLPVIAEVSRKAGIRPERHFPSVSSPDFRLCSRLRSLPPMWP